MPANLRSTLTQLFPPKPSYRETDVPDLRSKVCIVTGANTGVGKELARMLYAKNATVYVLARSETKSRQAIADIEAREPASAGRLAFLPLDLADLSSIRATVDRFLAAEGKDGEPRLHVLFNNAGVMHPPREVARTAQGHELHLGVNCLGTFLLTALLTPTLASTAAAATSPPGSVRVIWVASSAVEFFGERGVGIRPGPTTEALASGNQRYWMSKVGNWAHGVEYARRHRADGIVSVALNPGNLGSDLYRDQQGLGFRVLAKALMYAPVHGAYTELFAGFAPEITLENTGCWGTYGRTE